MLECVQYPEFSSPAVACTPSHLYLDQCLRKIRPVNLGNLQERMAGHECQKLSSDSICPTDLELSGDDRALRGTDSTDQRLLVAVVSLVETEQSRRRM